MKTMTDLTDLTDNMPAAKLARRIGVSKQRICQLIREGRVCGVRRVVSEGGQVRVLVPFSCRILPPRSGKYRPGPISRYIEWWELFHYPDRWKSGIATPGWDEFRAANAREQASSG